MRSQGRPPKQAHKAIPEGQFEEEQGLKGFFGPVSHIIKKRPSNRWSKIDGSLRYHMYNLGKLEKKSSAQRLFYNNYFVLSMQWISQQPNPSARRNADGDLLYFCHTGQGEVFTEYGLLSYRKGHYIIV